VLESSRSIYKKNASREVSTPGIDLDLRSFKLYWSGGL